MRVAWVANYPVDRLEPELRVSRNLSGYHSCSWIVNLADALVEHGGIDLHLLMQTPVIPNDQVFKKRGITFHALKSGIPFTNRGYPYYFPLDAMTGFRRDCRRIVRELRAIAPDVVHAHGTEGAFARSAVRSGYPCIVAIQGIINEYIKDDPCLRWKLVCPQECDTLETADSFICNTIYDENVIRKLGADGDIRHIPHCIGDKFFDTEASLESSNVLFVGAVSQRKGVRTLIEAAAQVAGRGISAKTLIAGQGTPPSHVDELKKLCDALKLGEQVEFLGSQSVDQLIQHYEQSAVAVLPTWADTHPNVISEAMACGIPVIAARVGGIPYMVRDGETGFLIDPGDPTALADRLCDLLGDLELRQRFGKAAKTIATRWKKATAAKQVIRFYDDILSKPSRQEEGRTR